MSIPVKLKDGTEILLERLTSTALIALLKPFIYNDRGEQVDVTNPTTQRQVALKLMDVMTEAEKIPSLANAILTVAPNIPKSKVWHNEPTESPRSGIAGLELEDVMAIIVAASNHVKESGMFTAEVEAPKPVDAAPSPEPEAPAINPDTERLASLQAQLDQLKAELNAAV